MRHLLNSLPKFALAAAALVLLLTAVVLRQGTGAAYESRDAFAAQVQSGERTLSTETIAKEWRSEIDAQRMKARRDVIVSRVLVATGLLALVAFAVSLLPTAATLSVPTPATHVPPRT
jgi:hypothetical protein